MKPASNLSRKLESCVDVNGNQIGVGDKVVVIKTGLKSYGETLTIKHTFPPQNHIDADFYSERLDREVTVSLKGDSVVKDNVMKDDMKANDGCVLFFVDACKDDLKHLVDNYRGADNFDLYMVGDKGSKEETIKFFNDNHMEEIEGVDNFVMLYQGELYQLSFKLSLKEG